MSAINHISLLGGLNEVLSFSICIKQESVKDKIFRF